MCPNIIRGIWGGGGKIFVGLYSGQITLWSTRKWSDMCHTFSLSPYRVAYTLPTERWMDIQFRLQQLLPRTGCDVTCPSQACRNSEVYDDVTVILHCPITFDIDTRSVLQYNISFSDVNSMQLLRLRFEVSTSWIRIKRFTYDPTSL
jgi:hypothetical protein